MATVLWNNIVEVSHEDAKQDLLNTLSDLGFTASSWQPFSMALTMVELSAEMRAMVSQYAVFFKTAFMAETATGEVLTRTARSFFAVERNPAVEAQHLVTLVCDASNGPYSVDVGELTFVHPNGSTFRNVEGNDVVYPATLASGGTLELLVEAEVAGVGANVADASSQSSVTLVLQTTLGGVTITKHSLERSGLDEEIDVRVTERCQLRWSRNLPKLGLIDEGVKATALEAAPAVTSVSVDSSNPRGPGTFNVYIAGLDATASQEDVGLVQSAIDVQTFGRNNSPKTCIVFRSPTAALDLAGTVYFKGATPARVKTTVEAALLAFVRSIPVGGLSFFPGPEKLVPVNDVESVIREAAKTVASNVTVRLETPSADLPVPLFGKVVRGDWLGLVYQVVAA